MAHLDQSYDSFETFLTAGDDAPWSLDGVWTVDLNALNSSGVSGTVVIGMSTEEDDTPILNVSIAAEGLTPGQTHFQHIHGLFDDDGNPADSVAPTIADDADRDGIVEVLEGVGSYGDIILSLVNANGVMPTADQNGQLAFMNTFNLNESANLLSPVTGNQYSMEDLMPLFLREVVLHGVDIPEGVGAGTDGEVNGEGGYVPIVPAAAGDIRVSSVDDALRILDDQNDIASDVIFASDGQNDVFAGLGNDTVFGNSEDNRLFGGTGDDQVFGSAGDDTVGGASGNDLVSGGAGDDVVFGGAGNDVVFGADGNDRVGGGAGDDDIFGGAGNDTLFGAEGDDAMAGREGNDVLFGGLGRDAMDGGIGNDVINAGPDDNAESASDDGASGALSIDDYDNGYAGGVGDDFIRGGVGDDIITGDDDSRVSSEVGTTFNADADGSDVIFGGAGNDEIHTGSWADSDDGLDNSQTGTASDFASGGDGDDIIRGAGGDDTLRGDAGDDNIGGGGGADIFVHNGDVSHGLDTIIDYDNEGDGDTLRVKVDGATSDDFTFAFTDDGDDDAGDADDLSVFFEGEQLFTLLSFDEGDSVVIETQDDTFSYTPMDDIV